MADALRSRSISAPFVHLLSASTDAILKPLLKLLRIEPQESGAQPLSVEEIRTIVLESSNFLPKKHVSILLNLFDLEAITVDDVMVPRNQIEAVDLDAPLEQIRQQIATAHHRRLLVYRGNLDEVVGTLRVRDVLNLVQNEELTRERLRGAHARAVLRAGRHAAVLAAAELPGAAGPPEPGGGRVRRADGAGDAGGHPRGDHRRIHHAVAAADRRLRRSSPTAATSWKAARLLRELNRKLGFSFPLDGPKTLNGLILEHLQDIPEPNTSVKIAGHPLEIVQTQDRVVKAVRVFPPAARLNAPSTRVPQLWQTGLYKAGARRASFCEQAAPNLLVH